MKARSRRGKAVAGAVATTVLALSMLLPGAAFADTSFDIGPLNLQRDCGRAGAGVDALGQCNYNIAQPSGSQSADAVAVNKNDSSSMQGNLQEQINILRPDASVSNTAAVSDINPSALLVVKSGAVDAYGHSLNVDLSGLQQNASASPSGVVSVSNTTGAVANMSSGDNFALTNAGANNDSHSGMFGGAMTDASGSYIGGWGGNDLGNYAGSGPSASGFGVRGGFGGSNVNLALGESNATGGSGGTGSAGSAQSDANSAAAGRNGELEGFAITGGAYGNPSNGANANGAMGTAGYGAQANAAQAAGMGGSAAFALDGAGGDASGANSANGGTGSLANSNSVSGTSSAWGQANGGTAGAAHAGNDQLGITGQNMTTVNMNGGLAANSLSLGISQSGGVLGYSGNVANTGSPSAPVSVAIDQASNPTICLTNDPTQTAGNAASNTQTSTSGAQSVTPSQTVSTGAQAASNSAVQDAMKAFGSYNTDSSNQGNNYSNQHNATNSGEIEVAIK